MTVKDNLKYTKDHEWLRLEAEDVVVIGITEYAQGELGDIVFIEVETVGEVLEAGEVFGSIEAVKTVSDMYMPVSGEVLEFNESLTTAPETINSDAYDKGWIVKIKMSKPDELNELLTAEAYQELIGA